MPLPADHPADRRDQRLAGIRRVSLWVAGGTAAATLGLGTAFAHALPGHHAAAGAPPTAQPERTEPSSSPGPGGSATGSPQPPPAQRPAGGAGADPSPAPSQLSQPQQPPATTPAPAQTTSGGS